MVGAGNAVDAAEKVPVTVVLNEHSVANTKGPKLVPWMCIAIACRLL